MKVVFPYLLNLIISNENLLFSRLMDFMLLNSLLNFSLPRANIFIYIHLFELLNSLHFINFLQGLKCVRSSLVTFVPLHSTTNFLCLQPMPIWFSQKLFATSLMLSDISFNRTLLSPSIVNFMFQIIYL